MPAGVVLGMMEAMRLRTRRALRAVALVATLVVPLALGAERVADAPLAALGCAALLAAGLVAVRSPRVGLGCVTAAVLLATATDQGAWPLVSAAVVAYLSGRAGPSGRAGWLIPAGAGIVIVLSGVLGGALGDPMLMLLLLVGAVALPWWVGSDTRVRTELRDAGWERAAQLERERQLVVASVRHEERSRLAAEMHDALGYELSVLALTAGAGEVNPTSTPERRAQFTRMREAAVRAVDSLHDVLRILREDESPQEIAADAIEELIGRYRESGATVEATLTFDPAAWPVALRRGLYRITQELLANAAKHAPDRRLRLVIGSTREHVTLSARNTVSGRDAHVASSGLGLPGVAERARALGGEMTVTRDDDVFEVLVTVPVTPPAPSARAETPERAERSPGAADPPEPAGPPSRWRIAALPLTVVVLACAALIAMNAVTATRIGMPAGSFDDLQLGMPAEDARQLLPPSHLSRLPPAFSQPEPLAGASCEFYRASDSWFDLGDRFVRVCFADGVLRAKDRLP
jgi:signal transduction histidine kinase